jgi:DNA polymerase-1
MSDEKLLLIDGPGLAYRSYFAFVRNPLQSSSGEQTSVTFGFARALINLAEEEEPDYWAVVFDHPAPTFRHEEYPEYKANRPSMPDDMRSQFDRLVELIEAFRVPSLELKGYEADDVIGALAVKAAGEGIDVVLVSDDKDFCQIVSDRIEILTLPRGGRPRARIDPGGVVDKLGVPPGKVVDLLALMGDSSDNVPGVRGIGPKTAAKLLADFSDLDDVYARIESVTPASVREKLKAGRESAYLSRRLVTLALDAPLSVEPRDLKRGAPDTERLIALLRELDFNRMAQALTSGPAPPGREAARGPAETAGGERPDGGAGQESGGEGDEATREAPEEGAAHQSPEDGAEAPLGGAPKAPAAISHGDFARGGLKTYLGSGAGGVTWAVALGRDCSGTMEIAVCGPPGRPVLARAGGDEEGREAAAFLAGSGYAKAVHDLKAEGHAASGLGWHIEGVTDDVMLASYLLDPEGEHDLERLAEKFLGERAPQGDGVTDGGVLAWRARSVSALDKVLAPAVASEGMLDLLREIEIPLAGILMEMEREGVALDLPALERLSTKLAGMIGRSEEDIYCIAGVTFNINSPQQLADVLFRHLHLPTKRRTKTGYSTDSSVLEELAADHELPREILNYRQLVKLKSTYVDALPRMVDPATGRVHATFHQAVTATGRLSSSNPNLQNIPIRTELGQEIRKAFVPGSGDRVLLAADYSQIELRIMAHLSGDEALRESFVRGEDVHAATASAIFGVPIEQVDETLRARAKTVNYGVMYGMGSLGLARRLGISRKEAADFIEGYFAKMPGVKAFLTELVDAARREGRATTILNRRRPLPAIDSSDRRRRAYAERMAVNTPLQGSAADIIKKAMVDTRRLMTERSMESKLILQVHDELVFECPGSEIGEMRSLVTGAMEKAVDMTVPLSVTIGVGENWWEAHA